MSLRNIESLIKLDKINNKIKFIIQSIIFLFIVFMIVFSSFNQKDKNFYLIDYYAQNGKWNDVLLFPEIVLSDHPLSNFHAISAISYW